MIICCLCPFIGRYFKSTPFGVQSWYYYKNVYDFANRLDRVAFCGYEKNFPTPEDLQKQKLPVFLSDSDKKVWRYEILDQKVYEKTNKTYVPPDLTDQLVRECGGSVFQAWRKIMTDPYPPLVEFYRKFLKRCAEKEPLEFIRATANDASMTAAAAEFKVPFVHYEKGPLRQPDYLETAYWDLSGVNGSTECEARWQASVKQDWKELELSREELLFLFCADNDRFDARTATLPQDADAGVAGQVDDDSNVIAYSHGYTNYEAIQYAENLFPNGKVIVRRHPTARTLCAGEYDVDRSVYHFIQRVGLIISINSSVSLETVLMGKNAMVLGDSPFRFLSSRIQKGKPVPPENLIKKLNFILLNYLVPVPAVDSLEYTQWRLSGPSELEIRKRHLAEFLRIRGFKDLKQFRKAFQDHHPAARKESAEPLVSLEPAAVVQREKGYAELAALHQELHRQHTDLENRHRALCEQHASLEKRHESICSQHADLEKRHVGLFQQYNDLGQKYTVLSSLHGELEQQFNDLGVQFNNLKMNYNSLCDRHADLEKRHSGICSTHSDLEKRHNALYRQFQDSQAALLDSQKRFGMQSSLLNEFAEKFNILQQDVQKNLPQLRQLCQQYSKLNRDEQCKKFYELWLQFITGRQERLNTNVQYRKMELHCHELTLKIQDLELQKQQFLAEINSLSGQLDELYKFTSESEVDQKKSAANLKQKYDLLLEQFTQLDRQNKSLNGRYTAVELQLENIRGQNTVLQQKFEALGLEHQEYFKQHEALLEQHNGLLQNYQQLTGIHQALKQNHESLTATHERLVQEHQTLADGHAALEQSLSQLGNAHASLKESYDTLNQKFIDLEQNYHSLDQAHAVLKTDHDRLRQECASLKSQKQEQDTVIGNLKCEHAGLQKEYAAQSRALADLNSEHEQLLGKYADLESVHQTLTGNHAALNEKYAGLNAALKESKNDLETLRHKHEELTETHAALLQKQQDLAASDNKLKEDYATLEKQHSELERDHAALQQNHQTGEKQLAELRQKQNELNAAYRKLDQDHAVLNEKYVSLQTDHQQLGSEHDGLKKQFGRLERDHAVLNEKYASLEADHHRVADNYGRLKQEYDSLTSEHAVLGSRHEELNQAHADLVRKQEETNDKYLAESKKNSELAARLDELEKKYQDLTEKAAGLERKNADLTAEQDRFLKSHAWRLGSAVVRPFQKIHLLTDHPDDQSGSKS